MKADTLFTDKNTIFTFRDKIYLFKIPILLILKDKLYFCTQITDSYDKKNREYRTI